MRGQISPLLTNQKPVITTRWTVMKLPGTGLEAHGHYLALYGSPGARHSSFIPDWELTRVPPDRAVLGNTAHSSAHCLIAELLHPFSRSLFLMNMNAINSHWWPRCHEPLIRIKDWSCVRLQIRCWLSFTSCLCHPCDNQETPIMKYSEEN